VVSFRPIENLALKLLTIWRLIIVVAFRQKATAFQSITSRKFRNFHRELIISLRQKETARIAVAPHRRKNNHNSKLFTLQDINVYFIIPGRAHATVSNMYNTNKQKEPPRSLLFYAFNKVQLGEKRTDCYCMHAYVTDDSPPLRRRRKNSISTQFGSTNSHPSDLARRDPGPLPARLQRGTRSTLLPLLQLRRLHHARFFDGKVKGRPIGRRLPECHSPVEDRHV
jgi:hypothetical protein